MVDRRDRQDAENQRFRFDSNFRIQIRGFRFEPGRATAVHLFTPAIFDLNELM